jgi:uncharacterized repeat protein (TIGR01451 family)
MKRIPTIILTASFGLAIAVLPYASHARLQQVSDPTFVIATAKRQGSRPGEILVRFRPNKSPNTNQLANSTKQAGREIPMQIERLGDHEIVSDLRLIRVAPADTEPAIEWLRSAPDVLYVEPNFLHYPDAVPNDPRYSEQWALNNVGGSGGKAGADIKAEPAWDITTGSRSIVVAVIDQGINVQHTDLVANAWKNPGEIPGNGIDDDGNGFIDDVNGFDFVHNDGSVYDGPGTNPDGTAIDYHGTHVAGTIGATGNNATGVAGVNWQVSLMSLKFLGPHGGTTADLLKALAYAKMMRDLWVSSGGTQGANIQVTNNSYGGGGYSQAEFDAIQALGSSGILFVASAGNNNDNNDVNSAYPASYDLPNVICVAATDQFDNMASFSNRGSRTVHLGAPGVGILSTTPGNGYSLLNGTSMASPHVAGVAALVLAAHPSFSLARLRAAILFSGDPLSSLDQTVSGRRLNALGALQNAAQVDTTAPGAVADLHVQGQDGRAVSLAWTASGDDGATGTASLAEVRFIDQSSGENFLLGTMRPSVSGSQQLADVRVPYRHTNGALVLKLIDDAGNNVSSNSVNVAVNPNAADPYQVTEGAAAALTTGGFRLHLNFDDAWTFYSLPFSFPFFETYVSSMAVSTNGGLFMLGGSSASEAPHTVAHLSNFQVIAGLWDDLDLRTTQRADADVYVVQPDANRVIFRWQGVPCNGDEALAQCTGGAPVNFEIEVNRDGTIITRYGDGNTQLHPVVGLGGGQREPFPVSSHTSDSAAKDLTNAGTVTFSLRAQPKKADLTVSTTGSPNPAGLGQTITHVLTVNNGGPDPANGVALSNIIPAQTSFVSCTASQGICQPPVPGDRTVKANLGMIASGASATVTIAVNAVADPNNPYYENNANVTAQTFDPNTFNGSLYDTTFFRPNPNPLTGITRVAAGDTHCLAVATDGSLIAYGSNFWGQLGDGTRTNHGPSFVSAMPAVKAVAAGHTHSLAIKPNNSLWAWGGNGRGQLGDGSTTDRFLPVPVTGMTSVKAVAGGSAHTLAVKNDGTVWAWGDNTFGQVGDGTNTNRSLPVQVPGLSSVIAVAAGWNHSIAVRADGSVWTWGDNSQSQLGDGTNSNRNTPTQVGGLTGVISVASEGTSTLALRNDGTVWSWGDNSSGQLGDGTKTSRTSPVQVTGLTGVIAIASGITQSLALRTDGSIWSWGRNFSGELGLGPNGPTTQTTPARVVILTNAITIAGGGNASYGIAADGTMYAWGSGNSRSYPYQVDAALPRQSQEMPSFGPDGGAFTAVQPVTVTIPSSETRTITAFATGGSHTAAVMSDGTVQSWGKNDQGQLGVGNFQGYSTIPLQVSGLSGATAVSAGYNFTLALKSDGTVWAWGENNGSLGDGTGERRATPVPVVGLTNVVAISAGVQHSLALRGDGTVWAFGYNSYGQLGDGTQTDRLAPVQVQLTGVKQISASGNRSMAVKTDGTVWAWGQFNSVMPAPVGGLANIRSVAVGSQHGIAVDNDGAVWTWGSNQYGELGDGTNVGHGVAKVPGLSGMVAVGAGNETSMSLSSDGTVWTWGMNLYGQLGNGDGLIHQSYVPYHVSGPTGVAAIDMDNMHVGGLSNTGVLYLWGTGTSGQLGDGTTNDHFLPIQMNYFANGSVIHYTTNGNDPSDDDPIVASGGSVMVDRSMVLKARAFRYGFAPSPIKSAVFSITLNPIDDARGFVRQNYLDFLGREPDPAGWDYWTSQITQCGVDYACNHSQRISVSAAFFIELEFQQTGSVVYRFYRAAFGNEDNAPTRAKISYAQFNADRSLLVGGAGLPQSTIDLANAFVQRSAFKAEYPDAMTPTEFVNHLFDKTSLTGSVNLPRRQSEIDAMTNNGRTRAQVLLDVIEIQEFKDREYKPSFVLMQYFGYLRRDPDQGGYDFWLNILNNRLPNDASGYRSMVCAFITSGEYQLRFGSAITRTNQDCSQ